VLEANIAEDPQVEIFETGPKEAVTAYVAVRVARADAACYAGFVVKEQRRKPGRDAVALRGDPLPRSNVPIRRLVCNAHLGRLLRSLRRLLAA